MCPVERERDPSGCRASGLTPELPVHVVLVSPVAGSAVVGFAAAPSSGAGTEKAMVQRQPHLRGGSGAGSLGGAQQLTELTGGGGSSRNFQ